MTGNVTFTPGQDDYVAAVRANFVVAIRRRPAVRRIGIMTVIFALIGAGIGLLDGRVATVALYALIGVAYSMLWFGIIYGLTFLLLPRRAAKLFHQQRTIHQPFDYRWSNAGLDYDSATANGQTTWADFRGWRETGPAMLIYMNDTLFQFLPRRAFEGDAFDDLRATLERSGLPIY